MNRWFWSVLRCCLAIWHRKLNTIFLAFFLRQPFNFVLFGHERLQIYFLFCRRHIGQPLRHLIHFLQFTKNYVLTSFKINFLLTRCVIVPHFIWLLDKLLGRCLTILEGWLLLNMLRKECDRINLVQIEAFNHKSGDWLTFLAQGSKSLQQLLWNFIKLNMFHRIIVYSDFALNDVCTLN